jgi:hypothetical protein
MWSEAVLRLSWSLIRMSENSTCKGVAPIRRANCVSVWIFLGIRFRSPMRSGRMSCLSAALRPMTMTPSFRRTWKAGRVEGRRIGMERNTPALRKAIT